MRPNIALRRAGRLLHHLAQLSGQRHAAPVGQAAWPRRRARRRRFRSRPDRWPRRREAACAPARAKSAAAQAKWPASSASTVTGSVCPSAWRTATLRAIRPIARSSWRTPASRVYCAMIVLQRLVGDDAMLGCRVRSRSADAESSSAWRFQFSLLRCSRPSRRTSMRSSSGCGIVSSVLAVVIKKHFR